MSQRKQLRQLGAGRRQRPMAEDSTAFKRQKAIKNVVTSPLSPLEKLPTEILEIIFFVDTNVNLPRASPYLGWKLSDLYLRREAFVRLCSTNYTPTPSQSHYERERAAAQSYILSRPWFDLDFLRQCIPDYMTNVLVREMSFNRLHWLDPKAPLVTPDLRPTIKSWVDSICEPCNDPIAFGKSSCQFRWREPNPGQSSNGAWKITLTVYPGQGLIRMEILGIDYWNWPPDGTRPFDRQLFIYFHILSLSRMTQIPLRLLRGPWHDEKIELLNVLIRGNASIDWINTTAGETAESGLWDALFEGSEEAVRALVKHNEHRNCMTETQGTGVVPQQEHFVWAIEHCASREILELLISAEDSKVDLQAVLIGRLIVEMEMDGHPDVDWIKHRRDEDAFQRTRWSEIHTPPRR